MEEAQKMVALKTTYADIIMNTAKEAAARIMSSERKALRFQQDLRSVKDEAIGMLLRLKHTIVSVNTEAEIRSSSQQRRIDELEAQLDEAEDRIIDLRAELKQAQDQLDKVKNYHIRRLKGQIGKQDGSCHESPMHQILTSSDPVTSSPSDPGPEVIMISEVKSTPFNQRMLGNEYCTSAKQTTSLKSHIENHCVNNPDLASIIMRSKEPELYRNGYTQRIRAFERNLLNGKLHPGEVDDQHFRIKTEPIINLNVQDTEIGTVSSPKTEDVDVIRLVEVPVNISTYGHHPNKFRKKIQRRKTRCGTAKATASRFYSRHPMNPSQLSSVLSYCKTYSYANNDNVKSGDGACTLPCPKAENADLAANSSGFQKIMQHNNDQGLKVVRRSLRKRKVEHRNFTATSFRSLPDQLTEPCQQCSFLSSSKTCSVNYNVKSDEARMNNQSETNMDTISRSTNFTLGSKDVRDFGLTEIATEKETELIDEAVLVQDGDAAESRRVSESNLNLKINNVPSTDSELNNAKTSEATFRAPSRVLKYTFSRKRKKESLTNLDEDASLEKSNMKRRLGHKQNGPPELHNSSLTSEVSRESQGGVQVAPQVDNFTATSFRSLPDQLTEPSQPCLFLSSYKTCSFDCNVKFDEAQLNDQSECNMDNISGSTNVTLGTKDVREFGFTEMAKEESELIDEAVGVQDGGAAGSPRVSESNLNLEINNLPSMDSKSNNAKTSEATNSAPSQATSRVLKYTFSRKCKKESLTNLDENDSLEKSSTQRTLEHKQNGLQEPQNSSLTSELSRDSRRVVQVARQLISLSGKKW
ncbi:uncharacterized protein LOC132283747 [Cornus florida]|uniref:uncharacterized protein LOC132283747 n=1 Tax=Cornus florida TaxID=4283 RepID=UPI00289A0D11|nr:uncharacterized protein LOC132283747 [Cornus florida]